MPLGLFARRAYLDRAGRPGSLADLKAHVLIGPDGDPTALAGLEAFGDAVGRSDLRLRTDSETAQIASVRAGLEISVIQADIVARDPLLAPVLPDLAGWSLDAWLVLHDGLRRLRTVRLVADHLSAVLPGVLRSGALPPHSGATVRAT